MNELLSESNAQFNLYSVIRLAQLFNSSLLYVYCTAVCTTYYQEYLDLILLVLIPVQPSVPVSVKMEGPAQLLTLVAVMWGGQECSAKQVHTEILATPGHSHGL